MSTVRRSNPDSIRKIKEAMERLAKKDVFVGLPDSTDGDLVMRGAAHQFGTFSHLGNVHIPQRPWLDEGVKEGTSKYKRLLRANVPRIVAGDMTPAFLCNALGEMAKGEVQKYFLTANFIPLSDYTIEEKESSQPLIDTGQLRNAVTYDVKDS